MLIEIFYLKIVFANNRFLNSELCEPHRLLCAPHFGKLSEFDKVLSFGASRTGFYAPHTLANFQSLTKFYPSLKVRSSFAQPSLKVRWECTPHTLANFQSLTKFYPSVRAARAFIYLNEQSVLRPVQLRTQCVRNWIHSIELPTKF